ncbi:hypothetical protein [Burkholderia cenocepacia]|uniref:hypothetical protein n=1 Tax=Burkholderia cenocepacia TaxID=95486 RepID=UPI0020190871|nr:hypothetical protein [Burkholderia cenocepacia]MCO1396391.1 hypothetical protein [Burkholderia cenocepacia]MCO1408965.1 hypothetical protein [Burkholderia cenocepacia]UQN92060.1 hypothetical protein L0Z06_15170 [Burkholderia cenocepacia]UQN99209.1 hypothetical protein L0Z39_16960 [Burkholderia cenocepacia]UQP50836.1 hypothetical protein L0Y99_10285 [Burkholderia cenocepacia]
MQPTTEKVVDIEKYRQQVLASRPQPAERKSTDPRVREMAYHLLMALECAKKLL